LKAGVAQRVECVEDSNVRNFCAQGTVGADGRILTHDAWHYHLLCFQQINEAGFPNYALQE
jgi:hypothetical protein